MKQGRRSRGDKTGKLHGRVFPCACDLCVRTVTLWDGSSCYAMLRNGALWCVSRAIGEHRSVPLWPVSNCTVIPRNGPLSSVSNLTAIADNDPLLSDSPSCRRASRCEAMSCYVTRYDAVRGVRAIPRIVRLWSAMTCYRMPSNPVTMLYPRALTCSRQVWRHVPLFATIRVAMCRFE
jgi:hypothetical protein